MPLRHLAIADFRNLRFVEGRGGFAMIEIENAFATATGLFEPTVAEETVWISSAGKLPA